MAKTKMCHDCRQSFLREQLIDYASPGAKTLNSYCPVCYEKKIAREKFAEKVCIIFGRKTPGPQIWTERKRLQDKYGYTDDIIVDCLDYIYNVLKKKKLVDSLCLINPTTVDNMLKYKSTIKAKNNNLIEAMQMKTREYIVPIRENNKTHKSDLNPDEWLKSIEGEDE